MISGVSDERNLEHDGIGDQGGVRSGVRTASPADFALAAEFRSWRKEVASELGIPAFRIMTNKTLDAIVADRPTTLAALSSIYGIYRQTREEYGEDILDLVRNAVAGEPD